MGGRGRLHGWQQRRDVLSLLDEAIAAGARQRPACEVLSISERCVQRWRLAPDGGDARKGPHTLPEHTLSEAERREIVEIATSVEFCDLSPHQIVCQLADQNRYVASASSFYRVLAAQRLLKHRQPSRPPKPRLKPRGLATAPGQVWVWDITYLPTTVRGQFVYLYWVMDLFSRYVVGWAVHTEESDEHASRLMQKAILEQKLCASQLVVHADNGSAMKGSTLQATLQRLEVAASYSRPGVSNDNAFCESSFRTLKYRPGYPKRLDGAASWSLWVSQFLTWYQDAHCHSGIGWVTPGQRHRGEDAELLARRRELYARARTLNPRRWSRKERPWARPSVVYLLPLDETKE